MTFYGTSLSREPLGLTQGRQPMLFLVFLPFLLQMDVSYGQVAALPNGSLEVAYRQDEGGKTDERVFLAKLDCYDRICELTSVDFGWCLPVGPRGEKASLISTDRKTTEDGTLKARARLDKNRGLIIVEEETSGAKITYRFEFSLRAEQGLPVIDRLTSFSGAGVKAQPIGQTKVSSWNLVPLAGEFVPFTPPCKLLLPGVPPK